MLCIHNRSTLGNELLWRRLLHGLVMLLLLFLAQARVSFEVLLNVDFFVGEQEIIFFEVLKLVVEQELLVLVM